MENQDLLNATRFHRYPWSWLAQDGAVGLPEEHQTYSLNELHLYFDAILTQGVLEDGGWVRFPDNLSGVAMGLDFILAHPKIESLDFVMAKIQGISGLKIFAGETHIALGLIALNKRPRDLGEISSVTLDLEFIDLDTLRLLAGHSSSYNAPDGFVTYLANQMPRNTPVCVEESLATTFMTTRLIEEMEVSTSSALVARYLRDVIIPRCIEIIDNDLIEGLTGQIDNFFRYQAKEIVAKSALTDVVSQFPGLPKEFI